MDIIFKYTRKQAIADGTLVDVSTLAREAGLRYPTAVTAAVWHEYVRVPESVDWQDETGRLWDILWMLRWAIAKGDGGSELRYQLYVQNDRRGPKLVTLKAICGPGDDAEPVLTIMLPEED